MAILDIRNNEAGQITAIQFDESNDFLIKQSKTTLCIKKSDGQIIPLATYADLDNFIKACEKAKELWYGSC